MKRHFYLSIAVCMLVVLAGMGYTSWKKQTVKEQQKTTVLRELNKHVETLRAEIAFSPPIGIIPGNPDEGRFFCISITRNHDIYLSQNSAILETEEKIGKAYDTGLINENSYIHFVRELTSIKNALTEQQLEYEQEVAICQEKMFDHWIEKEKKLGSFKIRKSRGSKLSCSAMNSARWEKFEQEMIAEQKRNNKLDELEQQLYRLESGLYCGEASRYSLFKILRQSSDSLDLVEDELALLQNGVYYSHIEKRRIAPQQERIHQLRKRMLDYSFKTIGRLPLQ